MLRAPRPGGRHDQDRVYRSVFWPIRVRRRRISEDIQGLVRPRQCQRRRARPPVRTGSVRRQAAARRGADRTQERYRPEHAFCHVVRRIECRLGADRCGQQTQYAQSGQPGAAAQLRPARHRADQRAMQLLAFPFRRQRGNARRGTDQVVAGIVEIGLPAEPGLSVRAVDPQRHQEIPGPVPP